MLVFKTLNFKTLLAGKNLLPVSTLLHLRIHFSFFLLPVFLFALSQATSINIVNTIITFLILHLLVFPSSNGYNSYNDRDVASIGLLKNPPPVSKNLLYVASLMDITAITVALVISPLFSLLVAGFILMSRAYSYRKIRLKKYPITAFLIVAIFQGGYVYLMTISGVSEDIINTDLFSDFNLRAMLISTLFIGSVYPLTQIYQHDSDRKDGITTLSFILGYLGSFAFSAVLFLAAFVLMHLHLREQNATNHFLIFSVIMLPVLLFFIYWIIKVIKDNRNANYENTMMMNLVTSLCMNAFFLILIMT